MIRHFCTYFDHRYLSRGLAMYHSLSDHCPSARLWVLCLSDECYRVIAHLDSPRIIPIALEDFEREDDELRKAKTNRSPVEYYFTCTPSLPQWVLNHDPNVDLITYVDSDLYFFSDPEPIFQEMSDRSIAIIPHRFSPRLRWMERTGIYNVGWLSFRRDADALACLTWWRNRCIEWCYDLVEADRYADQKYLDQFPLLFRNLKIIEHKGANLAAWNLRNYRLHERTGTLCVDDQPVVFYHFQGLRKIAPGVIDPGVRQYGLRVTWLMERKLFRPYMKKLKEAQHLIASSLNGTDPFAALHRSLILDDNKPPIQSRTRRVVTLLAAYFRLLTRHFLLSPSN